MRTSKHAIERIEGLLPLNALKNLTESIDTTIYHMIMEGWEYEEISDYLLDKIECAVTKHRIETAESDLGQAARMHIIGKQVVIIDECTSANNIKIRTVVDFDPLGIIWFEEEQLGSHFNNPFDFEAFMTGHKTYIHENEVSIQLVN